MGLGAILLAPLGDRFGRRPLLTITVLLIAVATIGTASAGSATGFAVWRLLTGTFLGACLPNATALVAELAPRRRRVGLLTVVSCGVSAGGVAAGFVVPPLAAGGWPMIFIVPGCLTALLALALFLLLPESPKLLLASGRRDALSALSLRLGLGSAARWQAPAAAPAKPSMLAPLARDYRFATFVFVGIYTLNATSLYMLVSWLPTVLPRAGFAVDQAARLTSLVQAGGLVTGLLLSSFLDRGRTTLTLVCAYLAVAAALLAFGVIPKTLIGWGFLLLVAGGGVSGVHLAMMAVGTSFYPPQILSSAIGFAVAVARVGAIAGPLLGGLLIKSDVAPATFLATVVVPVLACAAGVLLVPYVRRPADGRTPPPLRHPAEA
ncbi:MFS transporter [Sphingomonas sp. MMS24-J13]|uniref:MFS transporter n=1 Tax=Sphingomonas sp. MMS24-J13 TaxID=3238686 RepID=UPI00384D63F0